MIYRLELNAVQGCPEVLNSKIIKPAVEALTCGGLIVFPTETSYLLGGNALSKSTMDRLRCLKGRAQTHDMSVMVGSIEKARRLTNWSKLALSLGERYLPGPFTYILPLRDDVEQFAATGSTLGIRIPDQPFLLALLSCIDFPITATSANPHGGPEPYSVDLCVSPVDFVWDAGELSRNPPSTIIDFCQENPVVLRRGALIPPELT